MAPPAPPVAAPPAPPAAAPPFTNAAPPVAPDARIAQLEARCTELRSDVEHLALFARTLLALLEDKQIATEEQFQETQRKLDAQRNAPHP